MARQTRNILTLREVRLVVHSQWVAESTLRYMLADVWAQCVMEDINERAYDAELAGSTPK